MAAGHSRNGHGAAHSPYERVVHDRYSDSPSRFDPWELFHENCNLWQRLPVTPLQPFRVNIEEDRLSPGWRHFVRASPLRFSPSNRFDDAGNRHLTVAEMEAAMKKVTPEVYKPPACNPCGKSKKESSGENNQTCSICLEDFGAKQELYRLPCTHRFHSSCLKPWIMSNGQCPVCRFDLTGRPPPTNAANVATPHLPFADAAVNSTDEMALFIRAIEESLAWR